MICIDLYYVEMVICEIQVGKSRYIHQAEKINRNDVDNGIWGWFLNIFSCRQTCVFHIQSSIHYNMPMPVYHVSLGYFTNP